MDDVLGHWLKLHRRALDAQADLSRAWTQVVGAQRDLVSAADAAREMSRAGIRLWQAYADFWLPPK